MKKKQDKKIDINSDDLNLEKVLEKKRKKKRRIIGLIIFIAIIVIALVAAYDYFYGNKGYIRADVKIYSSSKLYSNSTPENSEDAGKGALFILYIDGIKRDEFLAKYEVMDITINGENVDLNQITYRHLNNALSIRVYSENYNLEKGNIVVISIKDKNSGQILTRRLHHKTELV